MTLRILLPALALSAAALTAGCGQGADKAVPDAPVKSIAAPAGQDWTTTVRETPAGGMVMGNPDAPVKLVEYASFTCPHCAEFSEKGGAALRDTYVKSGQVSWEFRPFLLNGIDAPVSILARCQGPEPFFKLAEQLYAGQAQWIGGFQTIPEAEQKRLQALPADQQMLALVRLGKLDAFFRQRGLPEAKIAQCLADKGQADTLGRIMKAGQDDGITGTPSFTINGKLAADTYTWETLEPQLKTAIAG